MFFETLLCVFNDFKEILDISISMEKNQQSSDCKYIKKSGESCTLNNNCKYPDCD